MTKRLPTGVAFIWLLQACAVHTANLAQLDTSGRKPLPIATVQYDGRGSEYELQENGGLRYVAHHDIIRIYDRSDAHDTLTVDVSKDRSGTSYEDRKLSSIQIQGSKGDSIHVGDISDVGHDHFVRLHVKGQDGKEHLFSVRYSKRFQWYSGIISPVLYKFEGSVSGFNKSNFAPSIGAGPTFNLNGSDADRFIGVNGLLTVYSSAAPADTSHPYSVAIGGIVDVNGILQLGASYHTKSKRTAVVVGVRPEVVTKLFGK